MFCVLKRTKRSKTETSRTKDTKKQTEKLSSKNRFVFAPWKKAKRGKTLNSYCYKNDIKEKLAR
jgi:hypothetical protein